MQFGANINTLMQHVMAMRTPALLEVLPVVEAKSQEERVEIVMRGKKNIDSVIRNWDKFSDVLAARGMTKSEVKRKGKDLKQVRGKLEMALRLKDPKIIPEPLRPRAGTAFDILTAWFELNKDYMESVYAAPKLTRQDIGELVLPPIEKADENADCAPNSDTLVRDVLVDGLPETRFTSDDDIDDVLDVSGKSVVH